MSKLLLTLCKSFCGFGLIVGTLFFAASLTPSLIPRNYVVQGILSGIAFGSGYGIGVILRNIWRYLELPGLPAQILKYIKPIAAVICLFAVLVALYYSKIWQNSVRNILSMESVDSAYPFSVCLIAILSFGVLLLIARALIGLGKSIANKFYRFFPRRVSIVAGVTIAVLLAITLANGVLVNYAFRILDNSFKQYDALLEPDRPQPLITERAGNATSQLEWRKLGRAGREFVSSGPTAAEIGEFNHRASLEPIRLYAGLQIANTPSERAQLLLNELIRVNAFNRAALVIITPTGTGWIDPSAIDGLEFLLDGNVASVALQYSYLNSPLSLLVQPESGLASSQALFRAVYDYWKKLPAGQRPKLYLHGLSLGAFNSQRSITFFDILDDPIDGAVWSGPPFPSEKWRSLTNSREAGSPEWLPVFEGGRFVRFMNQNGTFNNDNAKWGNLRFVYLQYASDAITFFEKSLFYQEADWMKSPRGPDVSPMLEWYPVVSMLQILIDMALADTVPMGYGHVYAPEHYLNAWVEVTGIKSWSPEQLEALKRKLIQRSLSGEGYQYRGG